MHILISYANAGITAYIRVYAWIYSHKQEYCFWRFVLHALQNEPLLDTCPSTQQISILAGMCATGQAVCAQAISKEAFEAEDALQRQLAKKLGIKGKKRKVGAPTEKADIEELDAELAGMPCIFVANKGHALYNSL